MHILGYMTCDREAIQIKDEKLWEKRGTFCWCDPGLN